MEDKYKTDDVSLTAFLLTQDVNLLSIVKENNRLAFVLSDPQKCEGLKQQYLNNALAPAAELLQKRKMLISQLSTVELNEK